ncbi:MAG: CBS domain-containing protein [Xanthobacteraceae bacterium]|nr:CBS domain-containing protein [Xanthobacteraceae bacterium]
MRAVDVMTVDPVSISPDESIVEAIRLMLQRKFSGLPVVDSAGALVGIVTEGDLLRRSETGTQRKRPRWIEFLIGSGKLANEYVHTSGRKVRDVMTYDVQTVAEDASLDDIVQQMERHQIKRLPVVRGGKLVGIVTRANLLRALASVVGETKPVAAADDASIRTRIYAELQKQPWAPVNMLDVVVRDGTVHLWGVLLDERQREAIHVVAENTPGVKGIEDHLVWVEPMSGMAIPAADESEARAKAS